MARSHRQVQQVGKGERPSNARNEAAEEQVRDSEYPRQLTDASVR